MRITKVIKDYIIKLINDEYKSITDEYNIINELTYENLTFDLLYEIYDNKTFFITAYNITDEKLQIFTNSALSLWDFAIFAN